MNQKYIFYGILIAVGMISYNVFLIQRDTKLFDAYNRSLPVQTK